MIVGQLALLRKQASDVAKRLVASRTPRARALFRLDYTAPEALIHACSASARARGNSIIFAATAPQTADRVILSEDLGWRRGINLDEPQQWRINKQRGPLCGARLYHSIKLRTTRCAKHVIRRPFRKRQLLPLESHIAPPG